MGSPRSILLSIVLPSYNDASLLLRHIPPFEAFLRELGVSYEIIISDDGSADDRETENAARQLGCVYVRGETNQGKGAAVKRGMLAAAGKYRIFTDADIPFHFEAIERVLWYLDFKGFDVVAGDRTLSDSEYFAQVPLLRRIGSHIYSTIVGRFVAGGWLDTQCGLKGFRAAAADDLFNVSRIRRFAFDVEILHVALKRNYDIKRIPVRLRSQEKSHVRVIRDGLSMVRDLGVIYFHQLSGHYRPLGKIIRGVDEPPQWPIDEMRRRQKR